MEGRESRARFCATCGERLDPDALFCAACGAHVGAGQPGGWVTLEFRGTVSQAYVWIPWWILLSLLVIPAGWGVASLSRWYLRNLWFSDGTEAWFEGSGGQIWWYFVVQGVFGAIGSFVPFLGLASLFVDAWVDFVVLHWFSANSRLSNGTRPSFTGRYWPYFGFYLLLVLSVFTIIGWAWVLSAMARWICRNLTIGSRQVVFVGSGWGFLWRGIAATLGSLPIVTLPWAWVWFMRWLTRSVVIEGTATSSTVA